ncbi:MAG: hypothetical protein GWN71_40750, partial [Gammaproteobacteria bacterium]|nr:hypothetical protein [Gammaproteobacteria bacterium]
AVSIPIIALTLRPETEEELPRERPGTVIELEGADPADEEGVFVVKDDNTVEF